MKVTDRLLVVTDDLTSGTLSHNVWLVCRLREYMYRFTGRLNNCRAQETVDDVASCTDAVVVVVVVGGRAPTYRNNAHLTKGIL